MISFTKRVSGARNTRVKTELAKFRFHIALASSAHGGCCASRCSNRVSRPLPVRANPKNAVSLWEFITFITERATKQMKEKMNERMATREAESNLRADFSETLLRWDVNTTLEIGQNPNWGLRFSRYGMQPHSRDPPFGIRSERILMIPQRVLISTANDMSKEKERASSFGTIYRMIQRRNGVSLR